jgi:glycosyltransferase involved in cell wall biosynthesis
VARAADAPATGTVTPVERCLSVVIPCFNEAAAIETLLARVLAAPATREVVVVDDGSTDGTRELLADLLAERDDERLQVILQPCNQGKGAALRRGFAEATSPFVVVQDADLEYDPSDYPALLGPLLDGRADVVFGSRFVSGGPHRVLYYWHAVGNRVLTTLSNMFTNLNLTDMETCYKVFRREVIQSLELCEDRFGFEPEVTAKLARGGWRIYEVGISYNGRTYDEGKKIGWVDGWRAVYCIVRYSSPGERINGRRPDLAGRRLPLRGLPERARGLLLAGLPSSDPTPGEGFVDHLRARAGAKAGEAAGERAGEMIDLTRSGSVAGRSG